jgi:hypothetical protein
MPRWTDDPATSNTHIRVAHIGELRRTLDFYRAKAGLPATNWIDNPVSTTIHFRWIHFTELRSAIQDLWTHAGMGTLPNWSVGSAPSSSRQTSARDINDLRSWVNTVDPPLNIWTVSTGARRSFKPVATMPSFCCRDLGVGERLSL